MLLSTADLSNQNVAQTVGNTDTLPLVVDSLACQGFWDLLNS